MSTYGWRSGPGPRATETRLPRPEPAGEGRPASGGGTFPRMLQVEIGGGYRAGGTRLAACFRAHAFVPAGFRAGWLMHPGIRFRRRFRCKFHFILHITGHGEVNYNHKTGAMSTRPPPPMCEESSSIDRNFEFYIWPVFASHFSIRLPDGFLFHGPSSTNRPSESYFPTSLPCASCTPMPPSRYS